jgi:hypothetical protein
MQKITKQLLVNKLNLPFDMLNLIKEYAFTDMITGISKRNKDIINYYIKNAALSDKNTINDLYLGNVWDDPINDPWMNEPDYIPFNININIRRWTFCATEGSNQFQAMFCQKCGNYIEDYLYLPYSDKITCRCT